MKNIIPYEKEIEFDGPIAEITSISLEHNEKVEGSEINGEFIIFGDYKAHQISINKDEFKYNLPFSIDITDNIDINSIKIDINDFTYDILDNKLIVKIELLFESEEVKDIKEEELDREIESLIEDKKEIQETKEEVKEEINTSPEESSEYIIYHVYVVNREDTIESICKKYNVTEEILHKYNEFDDLCENNKLLIPEYDE